MCFAALLPADRYAPTRPVPVFVPYGHDFFDVVEGLLDHPADSPRWERSPQLTRKCFAVITPVIRLLLSGRVLVMMPGADGEWATLWPSQGDWIEGDCISPASAGYYPVD